MFKWQPPPRPWHAGSSFAHEFHASSKSDACTHMYMWRCGGHSGHLGVLRGGSSVVEVMAHHSKSAACTHVVVRRPNRPFDGQNQHHSMLTCLTPLRPSVLSSLLPSGSVIPVLIIGVTRIEGCTGSGHLEAQGCHRKVFNSGQPLAVVSIEGHKSEDITTASCCVTR